MKKVLLVVGMHRSGTSALAGALSILGVDFGEDLLPAKSGENERGFFELKEVHAFHNRLLLSGGRTWDTPWPLTPSWLDRFATPSAKAELSGILECNFADSDLCAVKDPRLCQLLPLWREVLADLGVEAAVIHIAREPEAVATSLAKRNGFIGEKSGVLWLDHNLTAEHDGRGLQRAFVTYEGLLASKMETLEDLATKLDLAWPRDTETTTAEIEEFLTRGLDHKGGSRPGQAGVFGRWTEVVAELDRLLRDLAEAGRSGDAFGSDFDELRARQAALQANLDPVLLDHCTHLVLGPGGLRELQQTVDSAGGALVRARIYATKVEGDLGSVQDQETKAKEFIAALEKEIETHRLHDDEVRSYANILETSVLEKETLIRTLEDEIAKQAGLISGHEKVLQEAARYTQSLESELEQHKTRQQELAQYTQKLLSELEKHQNQQRHAEDQTQSHQDQLEQQEAQQRKLGSKTEVPPPGGPKDSQKPIEPEEGHD